MAMANIKKGEMITIHGADGVYQVKSVSRVNRGTVQAVLEKDGSRICLTRNQASFKHIKPSTSFNDKFDEILDELK